MVKFFVAFCIALFAATATALPYGGSVNTGASAVSRADDGLGNYQFGYNEDHATGGTFRKEKGGHGVQVGSYGLRDADGRVRVVNYVADALGFRASVSTNEPGVDPKQDPAATNLNGGHLALAAPVLSVAHAQPLVAQPLVAQPLLAQHAQPLLAHAQPLALAHSQPLLATAHAEPLYGGHVEPIASTYAVSTQHLSQGPVLSYGHAAAPLAAHY